MGAAVPTGKLVAYAALAAGGLLASVAWQQPALGAMAAPFALALVAGAALHRTPVFTVSVATPHARVVEGDDIEIAVTIGSDRDIDRLEVLVVPQPTLTIAAMTNPRAVTLRSGLPRTVEVSGRADRWGVIQVADVVVRARDLLGFFVREARFIGDEHVRVYPRAETLRTFVRPQDVQVLAGNQTARHKAEGVEFADLRPFVAGDRVRDVNWRVTARRGGMWVNQRHPDRNADVVVFLDVFTDAYLDDAVRAASMVVGQYLRGRDRVGLVSFGGTVGWLHPEAGARQLYRLVDALVASKIFENVAAKDLSVLPAHVLPPYAMILALTPLDDSRTVDALLELRHRGRDVAVVEIAPSIAHAGPGGEGEPAWRLWQLQRRAIRDQLRHAGVVVVEWPEELRVDPDDPSRAMRRRVALDAVGEELRIVRRRLRPTA